MAEKTSHKATEKATVDNASATGAVKEASMALAGVKKGAAAAKQAVSTIASSPSRILDSTVYGVSYGLSYGAVFSALMVVKMLPADGLAIKGFHEGAKAARKDFKTHEYKHAAEKTVSES